MWGETRTPKGIVLRYIWEYPNVLNEKVHKYSNTTSVLTTEQMFLWELNNSIFPHYLHVMNCSDTTKHRWQSKLLDYVWKVLWLQLYSVEDPPRVEVSSHLQSNRTYLYNSVLFCSDTAERYFHFTLLVGVSDSVDCLPSVQASRVLFRARVFCWSTTT